MSLRKVVDAPFTGSRLKLTRDWTICEYNGTVDSSGNLIDISGAFTLPDSTSKIQHDLAPRNAPTWVLADFQDVYGTRPQARRFVSASSQCFDKAVHSNFYIYDQDHTFTIVVAIDTSDTGYGILYDHGVANSRGVTLYYNSGVQFGIGYYNNGGGVFPAVYPFEGVNTGRYVVIQVVRSNNTVTMYADGSAGTPVDVTGYGTDDTISNITLGANALGSSGMDGNILYFRLDKEALSTDRLAKERDLIRGAGLGTGNAYTKYWTFARSTQAVNILGSGVPKLVYANRNIPRVGNHGGGILMETTTTNLVKYSEAFDNAYWTKSDMDVTANDTVALDGQTTADLIADTSDGGDTHHYITRAIDFTNTEKYTASLYVRKISGGTGWIRLGCNDSSTDHFAYFNLNTCVTGSTSNCTSRIEPLGGDCWCRLHVTFTSTATGTGSYQISIAEADGDVSYTGAGDDQFHIWGAQLENLQHATSYIQTTSATVQRSEDELGFALKELLPPEFSPTTTKYIDISIDLKYAWNYTPSATVYPINMEETYQKNRFFLFLNTDDKWYFGLRDKDQNNYWLIKSKVGSLMDWHTYRARFDFSDLSNSDMWIDGDNSSVTPIASTPATIETANMGDMYVGCKNPFGETRDCWVRNFRIYIGE